MKGFIFGKIFGAVVILTGIGIANAEQVPISGAMPPTVLQGRQPALQITGKIGGVWYWENECRIRVDAMDSHGKPTSAPRSGKWFGVENNDFCDMAFVSHSTGENVVLFYFPDSPCIRYDAKN
ncbi:MAG: hypothetical protein JHC61_06305 [Burkholderiaceae bacterium]|nr:hypothetical protein [Burkholderiaceae bacterium]